MKPQAITREMIDRHPGARAALERIAQILATTLPRQKPGKKPKEAKR